MFYYLTGILFLDLGRKHYIRVQFYYETLYCIKKKNN